MRRRLRRSLLGGEVEGVGGLVEEEHLASAAEPTRARPIMMRRCWPADISPTGLLARWDGVDLFEDFVGAGAHGFGDGEVGPEGASLKRSR